MGNEITCVADLLRIVGKQKLSNQYRIFYRGSHKIKDKKILPKIYHPEYNINEDRMIKEAMTSCPTEFSELKRAFDILSHLQHNELTTRLLDITSSPLNALFFACSSKDKDDTNDKDFIIFTVPNKKIKFSDSDAVSVLSNIAFVSNENMKKNAIKNSKESIQKNLFITK